MRRPTLSSTVTTTVTVICLAVGLAGCADSTGDEATSPEPTTVTTAASTTTVEASAAPTTTTTGTATTERPGSTGDGVVPSTADRAEGSGCTPPSPTDLPDGRWFGLVAEAAGDEVVFDLACWFTGEAAIEAAAEDGAESPPPNDYHVRNDRNLLRTLPARPDAPVTWYPDGGDPADVTVVDYRAWRTDRSERLFQPAVWLTVEGGEIVAIDEQWVP